MAVQTDIRVRNIIAEIAEKFLPQKIILFGSFARGKPTSDSDVDLLVILRTEQRPLRKAAEISASIEHPLPIDLLVRTPDQVESRFNNGDTFLNEILDEGITVYEA